jgi:hypothetical protein
LMLLYLKFAVAMCLMNKVQPSFLLHPLDLLTDQEVRALDFFPAMTLSAGEKHRVFKQVLSILAKHFTLVTMGEHATSVLNRKRNKRVSKVI